MSSSLLSPHILVALAVAVVFALLRRYTPAPTASELPEGVSIEELNFQFASVQWMIGFGMILVGVALGWITHKWLVGLNRSFAANEGPAYFRLLPSSAIWWFFPGFAALTLSWEITLSIWALFTTHEIVSLYIRRTNLRAGFNSTKTLRWMTLLIAFPIGVITLLAVPMHTTIHASEMRIGQYASLSSLRYTYKDVRRMAVVNGLRNRDGSFTPRAEIILEFVDGYRWSSAANRDSGPAVDHNLVSFFAGKIHVPVEYADTEDDLHLGRAH